MLRQNRFSGLLFEGPNCGLLRLRSDVGVVLKHLDAHVPCRRANGLFGNVRALSEASYKGMPKIMPAVGHLLGILPSPLRVGGPVRSES